MKNLKKVQKMMEVNTVMGEAIIMQIINQGINDYVDNRDRYIQKEKERYSKEGKMPIVDTTYFLDICADIKAVMDDLDSK